MEYVELARAESERGELVLRQRRSPRDPDAPQPLELRVNGVFVMDTFETSTERALAAAALRQVDDPRTVLIGGLGLGITLHEVLADHRVERAVVVEIEDALVRWMRDGTVPHGPRLLADERVHVVVADIAVAVDEAEPASYDLVLLDVDNGPGYLVHDANAALYERDFLSRVARLIRPGGALAIWSASAAPALAETLQELLGNVAPVPLDVDPHPGTGRVDEYWLYLSRVR